MQTVPRHRSSRLIQRRPVWALAFWLGVTTSAPAQVPYVNAGLDSGFAQIEFAQMYLDQMGRHAMEREQRQKRDQALIDSGVLSALDLEAPNNAVEQFNRATSLMVAQHSMEAIKYLRKAIDIYPKFVSAHIDLGLAYLDQQDARQARSEFELASRLDAKFPGSFLNLGLLALSTNDFEAAQLQLEHAASLHPKDARILSTLAYSQHGTHRYQQVLETAQREIGRAHV